MMQHRLTRPGGIAGIIAVLLLPWETSGQRIIAVMTTVTGAYYYNKIRGSPSLLMIWCDKKLSKRIMQSQSTLQLLVPGAKGAGHGGPVWSNRGLFVEKLYERWQKPYSRFTLGRVFLWRGKCQALHWLRDDIEADEVQSRLWSRKVLYHHLLSNNVGSK